MKNILYSILIGLIFCFLQSLGEGLVGTFLVTASHKNYINSEGITMFSFMRIVMTIPFYILIFIITDFATRRRIQPSIIALIINIGTIVYFYNRGMISKDPKTFAIASLIMSGILIYADSRIKIREYIKGRI